MAITSVGYDGTVNEAQWALLARTLGARDGVVGEGDWKVTAVAGLDRTVSVATGAGFGHGVRDSSDAAVNVQLPTLGSGTRWDTIVVHRDWQPPTGVTSFTYVTGTSTQAIAAGISDNPGVVADQVLALVQITAGVQAPTAVIDLRTWASKVHVATTLPDPARYGYGANVLMSGQVYTRRSSAGTPVWVSESSPAWAALSLASGFTAGTPVPQYRVAMGCLQLRGQLSLSSGAAFSNAYTTVASVSTSAAPARDAYVPVASNTTAASGLCAVRASGLIQVAFTAGLATTASLDGVSIPIGA